MITIDGSQGEGGGQILRTALALSMITGQAVRFVKIRAGRQKPGLLRQHLTALQAAAAICDAELQGAKIGARELVFKPASIRPGDYHFSIGTAGSTSLVLQTILPALLLTDGSSSIQLEGGTHNPFAPPFDFIAEAFLPLINRMGPQVSAHLERYGFYPAGGGCCRFTIQGVAQLQALDISQRGALLEHEAIAVWANLPKHIAERELATVAEQLQWSRGCTFYRQLSQQRGPGNYLRLRLRSEHINEIFSSFGQKGVSAEKVAQVCVQAVKRYLAAGVPVAEYLADQLLLPLALAGAGQLVTLKPSSHTRTNCKVIERFLAVRFIIEQQQHDVWRIMVEST